MEDGKQKSNIFKYCFEVFLEDEDEDEEDSLFMSSFIYLNHDPDEEDPHAKEYQSNDQNWCEQDVTGVTEKFEALALPHTRSSQSVPSSNTSQSMYFTCVAEENWFTQCSSQTLASPQDTDGLEVLDALKTSISCRLEREDAGETSHTDVPKEASSEMSPRDLQYKTDISKHSMDVYSSAIENTATTPESDGAKLPHAVSRSFSSLPAESTSGDSGEITRHLTDVSGLELSCVSELPDLHASELFLQESADSVMNPIQTQKYLTDVVEVEEPIETAQTRVPKSLSEAAKFSKNPAIHLESDCHCKRQITPISSKNCKTIFSDNKAILVINDDEHSVADGDIVHTQTNQLLSACTATICKEPPLKKKKRSQRRRKVRTCAPATNDDNDIDIIETKGNSHPIGLRTSVSPKNQISFSDDEPVIIISDGEHSDTDSDIVYVGTKQSSSTCATSIHTEPPLKAKVRSKRWKREKTCTFATNNNEIDIIDWKGNPVPDTMCAPVKLKSAAKTSKTSSRHSSDLVQEKYLYNGSRQKVSPTSTTSDAVGSRKRRKKRKSGISPINVDSKDIVFISEEKNINEPKLKYVRTL